MLVSQLVQKCKKIDPEVPSKQRQTGQAAFAVPCNWFNVTCRAQTGWHFPLPYNFISNSPCCFNKHPCHYFVAVSGHNHIKARVYCPSKAACSGFTLGCSWVCPGISFSQSEKSLITEKVTFSHPLNVYTLCKPIGGGQTFTWFYVLN